MQRLKYPLDILHDGAPNWISVLSISEDGDALHIIAKPALEGGMAGGSYALTIRNEKGSITVSETNPGTVLPAACPERHINRSGTFCIGLNAGNSITDSESVQQWWGWLEQFFQCQQIASKYGRWPPGRGLSHGDAGIEQLAMEKIAKELGWEEEIRLAIEHKDGWLGGDLPRHRKKSDMLVNQRMACPRGCLRRKGRHEYAVLRRKCPHRQQVSMLVWHESERRKMEAEFIQDFRSKGFLCCGTMKECPFANQIAGA